MSEVKRYEQMFLDPASGKMAAFCAVSASDYDALAAECERLRESLKDADAGMVLFLEQRNELASELAALKGGQEERREWPDDDIVAAWKWCEENGGTPAEFLSYSLLGKRSRVLGRPLTWREAIELTHATTDMPDAQRDKLLAMDDAPPAQASAWVPEYTSAMGEAAQQYIDECCRGSDGGLLITPPRMPGTFYWYELFARMLSAAPTPGASDGKGGE